MRRIKLTTMFPEWPLARQTPGRLGMWGDAKFVINEHGADGDWWVVYDDLPQEETVRCQPDATLLITPEPPALKQYNPDFVAQFDWVLTPDRGLVHPRKIYGQQGLPWHVGRRQEGGRNLGFSKDYDELKRTWPIAKSNLISVIASVKTNTPGHRARAEFVAKLQAHFGERIDVFGWGHREVPDKWDGIAPYKYHVAIENSSAADYWTEKLADAFLGGAHAIYGGCPNVGEYFDAGAMTVIDIAKPAEAIGTIERVLAEDVYDAGAVLKARELVLDRYNLFAMLAERCVVENAKAGVERTLRPAGAFYRRETVWERVRRRFS